MPPPPAPGSSYTSFLTLPGFNLLPSSSPTLKPEGPACDPAEPLGTAESPTRTRGLSSVPWAPLAPLSLLKGPQSKPCHKKSLRFAAARPDPPQPSHPHLYRATPSSLCLSRWSPGLPAQGGLCGPQISLHYQSLESGTRLCSSQGHGPPSKVRESVPRQAVNGRRAALTGSETAGLGRPGRSPCLTSLYF